MDAAVAEFTQALSIEERALGPEHPNLAYDLLGLADGELEAGKQADAIAHYERALALRVAHGSPPVEVAEARFSLARALVKTRGDRVRAMKLATQAGYVSRRSRTGGHCRCRRPLDRGALSRMNPARCAAPPQPVGAFSI